MDEIKALLYSLPHRKKVIFALYCCNDIKHLVNPEGHKCLELIEKWLEDNESVSMEELKNASTYMYAAYTVIDAAYTATIAAAHAATYSVKAAAYAAAASVYNAAFAADAASYAAAAYAATTHAAAAHNSNAKMKESKLAQYKTYLLKMIDELTLLEKEFI